MYQHRLAAQASRLSDRQMIAPREELFGDISHLGLRATHKLPYGLMLILRQRLGKSRTREPLYSGNALREDLLVAALGPLPEVCNVSGPRFRLQALAAVTSLDGDQENSR